jgi:hypothetical protein
MPIAFQHMHIQARLPALVPRVGTICAVTGRGRARRNIARPRWARGRGVGLAGQKQFVKSPLFEQLSCKKCENLNEIASQTGDAGHRKLNSRIEAAPKCRPAHPKELGVVLGNQKQADANRAADGP